MSKKRSRSVTQIALVAPGGPITRDLANDIAAIAKDRFGDQVQLDFFDQCFETAGHFAGTDDARSAAFLRAANDPAYDAVWFARGGYGACRLHESLWSKLNDAARAKTFLGYSDAGFLLGRLYKEKIGRPVHGPMPTDLPREGGAAAIARALDYLVAGDNKTLEATAKTGAPCAAFNITVLAHMVAGPNASDLADHIVMLEDVGEYLYRTDRALYAIMTSAIMKNAKGVMLGRLSDIPDNDRPFGQSEEEIARYWCAKARVPYLGRADIGHDGANKIVPFGDTFASA